MGFNNKLYSLRKEKGLSQDELGSKLNVSRQTISKWELGETTPELEKLIALGDFFNISLDELVIGIKEEIKIESSENNKFKEIINKISRKKVKKISKVVLTILGVILAIDIISMIIYFVVYGVPV